MAHPAPSQEGTTRHFIYTYLAKKSLKAVMAKVKTLCRQVEVNQPLDELIRQVLPRRVVAPRTAVAVGEPGKASAAGPMTGDARGDRVRAGVRLLVAQATGFVPGPHALAYRAPPVRRLATVGVMTALLDRRTIVARIAVRASHRRPASASTATSSNAASNGPPGSADWSAATNA
jgi:hypothetical protein